MSRTHLIRTIYLYLFALIGLVLLTIGGVGFVNMGLRAFVFTHADDEQRLYREFPPIARSLPDVETLKKTAELSPEEIARLKKILKSYEEWEERREGIDPIVARRHRDAAQNLALILIGLPLYLFHWRKIRKEPRNAEA